jgi:hypothetical protein
MLKNYPQNYNTLYLSELYIFGHRYSLDQERRAIIPFSLANDTICAMLVLVHARKGSCGEVST